VAPASGAPQFAQYLPLAAAPQDGHLVESGEDITLKLLTGFRCCTDNNYKLKTTRPMGTATEDYPPGAVGLPARGFGLVRNGVKV